MRRTHLIGAGDEGGDVGDDGDGDLKSKVDDCLLDCCCDDDGDSDKRVVRKGDDNARREATVGVVED